MCGKGPNPPSPFPRKPEDPKKNALFLPKPPRTWFYKKFLHTKTPWWGPRSQGGLYRSTMPRGCLGRPRLSCLLTPQMLPTLVESFPTLTLPVGALVPVPGPLSLVPGPGPWRLTLGPWYLFLVPGPWPRAVPVLPSRSLPSRSPAFPPILPGISHAR